MEEERAPAPKRTRELARQKEMATDAAFRAIKEAELAARDEKTEKLRLLRLQKSAESATTVPATSGGKGASREKLPTGK
jgi:hypothetical protein